MADDAKQPPKALPSCPEVDEVLNKLEKLKSKRDSLDEDAPGFDRKMRLFAKKELALRKKLRVERKRQKLREGFKGAPSSYRHYSFSSPVNRRIQNHQDIEPYNPAKKNPFFAKQMRRQREHQIPGKAARAARAKKKKEDALKELEASWKGVPYTTRKLSFSSTANRHIKNEQEYEQVLAYEPDVSNLQSPKAHEQWNLKPSHVVAVDPPKYKGLVRHHEPWIGSPSSYQKLSFSSSANKHIKRKQAIPGSRVTRTEPRPDEEPEWRRRERRELRWKQKRGGPPERVKRERGWKGSPSTYDFKLTFSSSANKALKSKQALPDIKPLRPR